MPEQPDHVPPHPLSGLTARRWHDEWRKALAAAPPEEHLTPSDAPPGIGFTERTWWGAIGWTFPAQRAALGVYLSGQPSPAEPEPVAYAVHEPNTMRPHRHPRRLAGAPDRYHTVAGIRLRRPVTATHLLSSLAGTAAGLVVATLATPEVGALDLGVIALGGGAAPLLTTRLTHTVTAAQRTVTGQLADEPTWVRLVDATARVSHRRTRRPVPEQRRMTRYLHRALWDAAALLPHQDNPHVRAQLTGLADAADQLAHAAEASRTQQERLALATSSEHAPEPQPGQSQPVRDLLATTISPTLLTLASDELAARAYGDAAVADLAHTPRPDTPPPANAPGTAG